MHDVRRREYRVSMTIGLPASVAQATRALAESSGDSVSSIVRRALTSYLAAAQQCPNPPSHPHAAP